jgi:hypothetical protein
VNGVWRDEHKQVFQDRSWLLLFDVPVHWDQANVLIKVSAIQRMLDDTYHVMGVGQQSFYVAIQESRTAVIWPTAYSAISDT